MDYLDIIKSSNLISNDDIEKLSAIKPQLLHAYTHSQVFRTRTEMEVSVLNDAKFPTPDSKYWQAIREQSVMFEELFNLSFEYRKNNVGILKLQRQLQNEEDDLERELLQIEIEKKEFLKLSMERIAKERIRELIEWQDIKDGLQIVCSPDDVNEHQLVSYTQRWINQLIAMGDSGSPPERWNLIGQLDKGIKECRKRGCLDKVYQAFDKNVIQFLELNGIGKEETECLPNTQKVSSASSGKNFITHNDWEISKLQFSVLAEKDGFIYVRIDGEDSKINEWIKRVNGTETTLTVVNGIIATLPPPIEKRVEKLETDIETIKSDVTSLKTAAAK